MARRLTRLLRGCLLLHAACSVAFCTALAGWGTYQFWCAPSPLTLLATVVLVWLALGGSLVGVLLLALLLRGRPW